MRRLVDKYHLDECDSDLHVHPRPEQNYTGLFLAILQVYILVQKRIRTVTPSGNNSLPPPWNPYITRLEGLSEQRLALARRVKSATEQGRLREAERSVVATTSIAQGGSAVPQGMVSHETYTQMKRRTTQQSPASPPSVGNADDDNDEDDADDESLIADTFVADLDFSTEAGASSEPQAKRPKATKQAPPAEGLAFIRNGTYVAAQHPATWMSLTCATLCSGREHRVNVPKCHATRHRLERPD